MMIMEYLFVFQTIYYQILLCLFPSFKQARCQADLNHILGIIADMRVTHTDYINTLTNTLFCILERQEESLRRHEESLRRHEESLNRHDQNMADIVKYLADRFGK